MLSRSVTGLALLALALGLSACKKSENNIGDVDEDGDGVNAGDDCDDTNADVSVLTVFYADTDGDGYGDHDGALEACTPPEGYVTNEDDCDDSDNSINPDGNESCDGVDEDCDGEIDDGMNQSMWFPDVDEDGFGDPDAGVEACVAPEGYIDDDNDCDDEKERVHPGADEVCNAIDDDCDGDIDEDAIDTQTYYADTDGDGYGDPGTGVTSCDPPAGYVTDNTDCDDSEDGINPGHDEICDGVDEDCDGNIDNDPTDGAMYAVDDDRDNFGAPGTMQMRCRGVKNTLDCDDFDPTEPIVVDISTGSSGGAGTLASPLDTIQAGIDLATQCVVVYPGTYDEAIDFNGSNVAVTSVAGPADTIIDASGTSDSAVVSFTSGETSSARLDGFTLTGGTGRLETTSSSYACSSTTTCTDYYSVYCGGGVVIDASDPSLQNLIIDDNTLPAASTSTSGNDTYYTYSYGGGICAMGSNSTFTGVSMFRNSADQGGGLYVDDTSSVDFVQSQVFGNTGADGAAFQVDGGSLTVTNVVSAWNIASSSGGGVLVVDGALIATNVTHGSDDSPNGAGIYASGSSLATVMNSIVYGAMTGVGVKVDSGSTFTGTYNDVYGNTGGEYSGTTDPTGTSGNISSDPRFSIVSDDGDFTNDDWTLAATSPAINTGNAAAAYNDPDGSRNDMGAYGGPGGGW